MLFLCKLSYSQDAESYYRDALEKAKAGKIEEAIVLFTKTIELQPENYLAWFNRGISYAIINKYERSLNDNKQVIKLEPSFKKAYLNVGIAKRHLADYDGAIAVYSELIEADSGYIDAWYNRAFVYEWIGYRDSACADYRVAEKLGAQKMENKIKMCNEPPKEKIYYILYLDKAATSDKYGYTEQDPIMVGPGPMGGPSNQRAFLELLRDSHGEPVQYQRIGGCCQYKSENGLMGYALLDKYKVDYTDASGKPASTILYISMYDYKEPMIPVGFKGVGFKLIGQ